MEQARGTFKALVADVLSEWNATHGMARSLPTEVLATCFAHLRARDLVRVTHVSRQWRGAALAIPRLWADSNFFTKWPRQPEHVQVDRLSVFLERAKPHPVDIDMTKLATFSAGLLRRLVQEHMPRMRSLRSPASNARSTQIDLRQPAPALVFLFCDTVDLSSHFLGGKVGCLQILQCRYVSALSDPCSALSTLRSFEGAVDNLSTIKTLLLLCPVLHEMVVCIRSCPPRLPALVIPPSLVKLGIYIQHQRTTDWKDFLTGLDAQRMHFIALGEAAADAENLLASLRRSMGDPVHIECRPETDWGNTRLVVLRDALGVERGVYAHNHALAIPRNISGLVSLTLNDWALSRWLFHNREARLDFPTLTTLRIEAAIDPDMRHHIVLHAPRLERMTWRFLSDTKPEENEANLKHLAPFVRALLEPSDIRLAHFELVWPALPLHRQVLPPAPDILALARTVTVMMIWVDGYTERDRYSAHAEQGACDPVTDV